MIKCSQCDEEAAVYCEYKKQVLCKTHCVDCNLEKKFAACPHASIIISNNTLSTLDKTLTFQNKELNEKHVQAFRKTMTKLKEELSLIEKIEELEKEASTDHLTQTLTKRRIEEKLKQTEEGTLVMIDLDNFKKYNDENGHLKGDEKLKQTALKIKENLRKTDFIGRFGGDEFLIIMPQTNEKQAELILKRIKEKTLNEANTSITYGLAEIKNNPMEALKQADDKLMENKNTSQNH